jgi:hypothetical protein
MWFVSESDFRRPKSSFIRICPSSKIPNSSALWFYFVWWKKLLFRPIYLRPKKKLTFNCVLCYLLVNRIFWYQKAVLFGSFRLPIFQILGTFWFYFIWWKKLLYQPIYLRPNKNSRWIAFCVVRLRIGFSGTKSSFIRIFPPSNIPNS